MWVFLENQQGGGGDWGNIRGEFNVLRWLTSGGGLNVFKAYHDEWPTCIGGFAQFIRTTATASHSHCITMLIRLNLADQPDRSP